MSDVWIERIKLFAGSLALVLILALMDSLSRF